jgi:hypothetical protein
VKADEKGRTLPNPNVPSAEKGFRGEFWETTQDQLKDGTTTLQQAVHEAWSREVEQ